MRLGKSAYGVQFHCIFFSQLIYLTVCSGYTFFNTFIDIARYITFIYQHCQQYYNDTHSIQLGEVGVIQLYGNDPDMAK